ncbi:MAG: zinc-dependent metalloprotease [Gemmatimonadetes bacterium]|nr:zinc-dependent metalloprotease [Gemmatimonadota bacterium]
MRHARLLAALTLAVVLFGCARAAPAPAPSPPGARAEEPTEPEQSPAGGQAAGAEQPESPQQRPGAGEPRPRPYNRVITAEAKTRDGLFKTHRVGTRLYFEIPRSQLGKEMLLVRRAARVPVNMGNGGQELGPSQVVKWERLDNRVLLRTVSYETVADSTTPIYQAVRNSNNDVVIGGFNVETYGPDSAAVIDVTRLYTAPPPEMGPGNRFRNQPDANRSFIERVLSFPENVEVEATLTYPPAGGGGGQQQPSSPFEPNISGTASLVMHWSMVKLPEKPMMPRLADKRIGFFSINQLDYGRPEQRAEEREYIVRWRLEKKDPAAQVSEPVKPIVYYVDPATPDWLKPWIRSGIEAWQPAFEAAGFRRAIIAADPPSQEEDPDWSPEDARYSVVRWFPSTIENAVGPNVHDPRTGEILESDIYMYHNIMNLQRAWYFIQVGHLDPRARMWPVPDSLMGRLVEFVVSHEVGHTLGYQHDQKGSSTYPADSVRSATWVKRMGHAPSIMDYSRFNYAAQPEDGIAMQDLIPRIGPWDVYTTRWGYTPIPSVSTADEERPTLDRWAREQDAVPWYRFSMSDSRGADPGDHTEAVGDADPVKATGWGIRSIKQIVPLLVPATVHDGDDYDDLSQMYGRLINQWATELRHVAILVGGADAQEKYAGQDGPRYQPWPRARQKDAVRFLNENAFATPSFFLVDDVLRRIEVEGALRRINTAQAGVLNTLFNDRRLERLIEFEAVDNHDGSAYGLLEMLADVRGGIWSELASSRVTIDTYRRELQRTYLTAVRNKLNPPAPPAGLPPQLAPQVGPARATSDVKAGFRSELRALDAGIQGALSRVVDRATRAHLEDARDQIRDILEPERAGR